MFNHLNLRPCSKTLKQTTSFSLSFLLQKKRKKENDKKENTAGGGRPLQAHLPPMRAAHTASPARAPRRPRDVVPCIASPKAGKAPRAPTVRRTPRSLFPLYKKAPRSPSHRPRVPLPLLRRRHPSPPHIPSNFPLGFPVVFLKFLTDAMAVT